MLFPSFTAVQAHKAEILGVRQWVSPQGTQPSAFQFRREVTKGVVGGAQVNHGRRIHGELSKMWESHLLGESLQLKLGWEFCWGICFWPVLGSGTLGWVLSSNSKCVKPPSNPKKLGSAGSIFLFNHYLWLLLLHTMYCKILYALTFRLGLSHRYLQCDFAGGGCNFQRKITELNTGQLVC